MEEVSCVCVCVYGVTWQFPDGTEFEGSRKRGRAFQFKLGVGQVVEGVGLLPSLALAPPYKCCN